MLRGGRARSQNARVGILAYWWEGLRQLIQYRFPEMRVAGGGEDLRATLVVIGRTVNYGGPFKITTGANLFEDSRLERAESPARQECRFQAYLLRHVFH